MNAQNLYPGPIRLHTIGTKWLSLITDRSKMHEFYEKFNENYGVVVMEAIATVSIVLLFNREDTEKVLSVPSKQCGPQLRSTV